MIHNVVLLLILATPALSTNFTVCAGTTGAAPTAVRLKGCDGSCQFRPGEVLLTQVDIKTKKLVTSLNADLYAAETYHLLNDPQGCSHLVRNKCPLSKEAVATYAFNITVKAVPLGKLPIHFTLTDQKLDTVACFDMEITVVSKTA